MKSLSRAVLAASLFVTSGAACDAQEPPNMKVLFNPDSAGSAYRAEVTALEAKVRANGADAVARRGLIRALSELGRYEEAERTASAGGNAFGRLLGEAFIARGQLAEAAAAFQTAIAAHAPDSASARLGLAIVHARQGDAGARRELEWFIPFYNNAPKLTADELTAVGRAVAALGNTDPQLFKDAVKAFGEAGAADPRYVDARIYDAMVFLDKFDSRNGTPLLQEALAIEPANPRALTQLARAQRFDGNADAIQNVDHALAVNPRLVAARVLKAELLFASEDYAGAGAQADSALAVDPTAVGAIGVKGALSYLAGDRGAYDAAKKNVFALNPRDTEFLTVVAGLIANERRYAESIALAQEAVAIDSTAWAARTLAGMGEFRLGRFDAAGVTLAAAFKGDPYNPWVKNTLDLMDKFPQYQRYASPRFDLLLNKSEGDLIALYMQPLAEAAYDTFATRYHWKPADRIRLEVYPRHGDFSVRTVGLAGLGALGVSFGDILAMDSPSARQVGEFHWASTLWHEVAHTFTLGLSRMTIPRWLTEGISGWEETRAHAGWGDPLAPAFLAAYGDGRLPPLSKLTPAFIRPAYPEQVMYAYQMAELVVEHIVATRGLDAVRRMVAEFGDGKKQPEVFRNVLKTTPEAYDAEFDAYMRKRFAGQLAAVKGGPESPYATHLGAARALLEAGQEAEAAKELDAARTLIPEYAGPGSPYAQLAQLAIKRADDPASILWLDRITQRYAQDYNAWVKLAELREKTGDRKSAAAALEQAMLVHPFDPAQHDRLASLYIANGRPRDAVRERRAIVALKPVDKASAYYNLAVALDAAGERSAARSEVLRALEIAPGYAVAQELLLKLQAAK
ncbi:MAG: tetratricopeptide repeat protein [Longimicrobiales bacterium]